MTTRTYRPAARDLNSVPCGECGMTVKPREYHPFWFCVLYKAGQDPRAILRDEQKRWTPA